MKIIFTAQGYLFPTKKLSVLVLILFSFFRLFAEESPQKNIYIINSQNPLSEDTKPAVDQQVSIIKREYPFSQFFFYYLDNDRFDDSNYDLHYEKLDLETEQYPPDLIIVNGYDAYFYVMHIREELGKETPIVFSGITDRKGRIPSIPQGVTGIPDILDVEGIISLTLQLQPKTENLYLILDKRVSNRTTLPSYLEKAIADYEKRLNIIILKNYTIDEVSLVLNKAKENSVALMYPLAVNSSLDLLSGKNPYEKITDQNIVPIYSFYDFAMNIGVVGGYISSSSTYGKLSGSYALRVLNGEDPSEIEIPESGYQELILDYKALKKYHIPFKNIPENAILINRPFSFYNEYKHLFWLIVSLFMLMMMTILGLFLFIIWRNKMQKQLMRLKSYLSNIINSMPSLLIGVDYEGRIILWNEAAVNRTGIGEKEAKGLLFIETLPQYSDDFIKVRQSIKEKKIVKISSREQNLNNKNNYENITIFPLVTNGVEGAIFRIDNVTHEKNLQERLNHKSRMDALGTVSAGIAHDFNNMLGGITGTAQVILSSDDNLSKQNTKLLEQALSAAFKSSELTKKLLIFSRMKKIDSTPVDMDLIIDDTLAILQRTLDKRIEISVDKQAQCTTLIGDNSSLQNSLLNLGINASHAMKEGGKLSFRTKNIFLDQDFCQISDFDISPGEFILIEVSDTGCGMPPSVQEHIFEPFFTTKEKDKGTGLGLSTVYGTVKDHRGSITVESSLNKGSLFSLLIPCGKIRRNKKNLHSQIKKGEGKILLVDDEEIMRATGCYLLEMMGYEVTTAQNGKEALRYYREHTKSIDMVITDMVMPEMNGEDLFYKLKEINPECKVILSSGFSSKETVKKMKEDGLAGFISKPYKDFELSSAVSLAINPPLSD